MSGNKYPFVHDCKKEHIKLIFTKWLDVRLFYGMGNLLHYEFVIQNPAEYARMLVHFLKKSLPFQHNILHKVQENMSKNVVF